MEQNKKLRFPKQKKQEKVDKEKKGIPAKIENPFKLQIRLSRMTTKRWKK